jgi:hypothetical protein
VEPVRRSATWTRSGTPEAALSAIEAYARNHNGRVEKNSNQLTLYFGSRFLYRFMGLATTRFPYAVRVSAAASPGTGTELAAEAYSNEGPYLFRLKRATRRYQARFSETLDELRQQ